MLPLGGVQGSSPAIACVVVEEEEEKEVNSPKINLI
jgi:hypothetical protein